MFFTGFSSPFISILLAVILPYMAILFGKETLVPTSIIQSAIQIEDSLIQNSSDHTSFHYSDFQSPKSFFTDFTKNKIQKISYYLIAKKQRFRCAAKECYTDSGCLNSFGNKAPPSLFAI